VRPLCNHLQALDMLHLAAPFLPLATYLAAAALIVRQARVAPGSLPAAGLVAGVAGVILHAALLFGAIRTPAGVVIAITDSASLVGWVVATTTVLALPFTRVGALAAALLPFAGLLAIGTGLGSGFNELRAPAWEVTAHIALAALAAGWLSVAAVVVLVLSFQDARLRSRQPLGVLTLLPPMETMESTLFQALGGGFVVLTLALITGFFFVTDPSAQHVSHKIVLTLLAWAIFGVLLWGRVRYGWRGRKALRFTVAGFALLALGYFGTRFVLENVLGRHWG
jgi:ABC-type uncharacterized transport system permease subunit